MLNAFGVVWYKNKPSSTDGTSYLFVESLQDALAVIGTLIGDYPIRPMEADKQDTLLGYARGYFVCNPASAS